jgi:2-C-methyl-D-erythritol 2,4-cyclodiphosphate synthase
LFPPTDNSIEGISSLKILEKAAELVRAAGGRIENIDSTLIAEEPRVMKHAPAMKKVIAGALGIEAADIGIKATTNETMGFIGRREGIAALASASVAMPERG